MLTVEGYRRWAHSVANALLPPHHPNHDDVVQEGLIEVHRVLTTKDDPSAVYVAKAARNRMLGAVRDGKWTGLPDRRLLSGPGPTGCASIEALDEQAPGVLDRIGRTAVEGGLEAVEWSALSGAVVRAVESLPDADADYTLARFYGGWRDAEIARATGRTTKAVCNRWQRTIRPALAARLAHLADALPA